MGDRMMPPRISLLPLMLARSLGQGKEVGYIGVHAAWYGGWPDTKRKLVAPCLSRQRILLQAMGCDEP